MTSAHSVFGPTPDNVRNRANWLGRYLTVERAYDAALDKVLKDAVASIDSAFGDLDDSNISRQIRRQQLALAHKQVKRTIRETFGDVRNLIKIGRQDGAVAAVNAHLFDERGVLARLFKSPADRQNYADSLRATAARNIEAVATRVLQTEIPLSERVWKTRALANGQVSRAINNGLAKGDSWLNIAESVKHLVRPDTPGGISYAAKRLGRTEINNAFHAQSIHDAQQSPWVDQMRWRLSKVHETDPGDECEVYAEQEFFPKEGVPVKPHPNCRCYVIPALLDYDQFETNLLLGQYDSYIDERMGKGTADRIIDFRGIYPKGVKPYGPDLRAKPNPETPPITANIKPIEVKTWRDVQNVNFIEYWFQQAHPDIDVINFNSDNISLEDAKQLLGAVDDMVAKYPALQGNIKSIVLGYGPDDEYARTIREFNGKSTIKFNLNWTKDHDHFYERVADNVATGFHPPGTDANPYYDMVVHELGHALDNVGDQRARDRVYRVIENYYDTNIEAKPKLLPASAFEDFDDFRRQSNDWDDRVKEWRKRQSAWYEQNAPSKYSLDNVFGANNQESLAEAFLDVERNGKEAKPVSKALYDLLIEESKKDVGPRQLSDLVSAPASESGLVKGDYVPNGAETWDFIEVPYDDGRWDYYEVYDKRNELGSSHDWTIEPRNYPEKRTTVTKFDRRSTVFFDPKETDVVEGEFGFEITTPEVPLEDSFEDIPEKMLWRGMSKEEYELARKRGYFESLGEYNVGGDPQAGKTYFSTDVGQAGHYATWYAPPQFKPTFDHPGYVVGIEDIPDLVREQGTEVGVPGRIPFKDVKKVYKGKPYAIFPGEQSAVREFNDNWVPGGSVQPGIRVKWSEVVVKPKDVVTLQQTSMIEAPKRRRARLLDDSIPDISFLDDELTPNPADIIESRARTTGLAYLDDAREFLEKDKKIKVVKGLTPSQQLDPIAVVESVDAVDTMTTRFPHAGLKEFGFADIGENVAGYTEYAGTDKNWMVQSRILLNDEEASNYFKLKEDFAKAVAKKWHYVGSDENPILSTIYHEYGHVIHNATISAGLDITPDQLDERLLKFWEKWYLPKELENIERKSLNSMRADIPAALWDETFKRHKSLFTTMSYEDWIVANTSGYSRSGGGSLETHEALAEAFDVVERLGEEAPEPAKVMRNFLLERYEETLKEKGIQEKKNWRYVKEHLEES